MIPPGFPGAIDDAKIKAIQKFDKKAALEQLKGTPFEGGKNWPKITLTHARRGARAPSPSPRRCRRCCSTPST